MAINFHISSPSNFISQSSNTDTGDIVNAFSGVGSFIAVPFMATENLTLNRCIFWASSASGAGSIMVGFGTWDGNSASYFTAGVADSLNFISQSLFSRTSLNDNSISIFAVPDFNIEAGKKYFMGFQVISRTNLATNMLFLPHNQTNLSDGEKGNYSISYKTTTGVVKNFSANHSVFNWGYYSGTGVTQWYNPMYGGSRFQYSTDTVRYSLSSTGSSQFGMTFYMDWNVDAIEMEEFGFVVRSAKASYGAGVTYNVVLYDSDGTTPLTASTQSYMPFSSSTIQKVFLPLKYTLKSKKQYYFAFNREASNAATDYIVSHSYLSEIMAGNSITTYVFTKDSPSTAPVIVSNQVLIYDIVASKIYGNRQGSSGNILRRYDPSTQSYIGNVEGYDG